MPEVYPALGWGLMVLPLASIGALCGAAALWITRNRSSARAAVPWVLLSLSILAGGGLAILSAIMLADPCGLGS